MISIQYLSIWLDEEHSSAHENSGNTELVALWAYSWTEYLALWIWFTSTVAVCRPAVSTEVSPRISSSPAPATRCPFAINNSFSMWSAPNKAEYFGYANFGYFHWIILLRTHIGWSEQSAAVTCWGFKMFVYSMQSFIRWCCKSGVCTTSFKNGKMELFEGVGVGIRFFLAWHELHACLSVVSAHRKFSIQMASSFWWSFNISSHHISSGMLIVVNAR